MTKIGHTIQVIRSHDGRHAGYRGKVRLIIEIDGMKLFIVQWENTGRFGILEPGYSQWMNLGKGPPAKDMSKDASKDTGGTYTEMTPVRKQEWNELAAVFHQEALLGQRRRR